jgi:hypothetical protein
VLKRLASWPHRLADLAGNYFPTQHWNEKLQQDDGTITRRPGNDPGFAVAPENLVLSGPHFFVATPFNKTPKRVCETHKAYDSLDLEALPVDYLPRTNYQPMSDRALYRRRTPRVGWVEPGEAQGRLVTEFYRHTHRRAISTSMERTAIGVLIPPSIAHIDGCFSLAFRDTNELVSFSSALASVPIDFLVKSTGKGDMRGDLADKLPVLDARASIHCRYLVLNCLTTHYTLLWEQVYDIAFADQNWSQPSNPRLPQNFWARPSV